MRNNDTDKLISEVYSKLDKDLGLKSRMKVCEELSDTYLIKLNQRFEYYSNKPKKDISAFNQAKAIAKCMDAVSNYLLFCEGVGDEEYPYTMEDNYRMPDTYKLKPMTYLSQASDSNYKVSRTTIKDYINRDDIPDYIQDYIDAAEASRHTIQQVEKQVNRIKSDIDEEHIFFYKSITGKDTSTSYENYKRMRRVTGYTKNNSVELDKEILYMLRSHYETITPRQESNVWAEVVPSLDEDDGLDIDLLDRENLELLIKNICHYGESKVFDAYFEQIHDLADITNLTDVQREIFHLLKRGATNIKGEMVPFTVGGIAAEMGRSRSHIASAFDLMVTKISDEYEKIYEDKYYTYIAKGKYKVCSVCGKPLLKSRFYFYKDSKNTDGLKSECINCTQRE